jgi:hypothetical protein
MTVKQLIYRIAGMAFAYACVLIVPTVVDFICAANIALCVIVWLNVGLFVMRIKKMPFPEPSVDRIDIRGGLRVLRWALFSPRYLLRVT